MHSSPWRWAGVWLYLTPVSSSSSALLLLCISLILFSSFPIFLSLGLSAFFWLPLPAPYNVLLRKCASAGGKKPQHQYWAGFKAGVGGGGVHYARPPTHPQRSMAFIQILDTCSLNMAALYDQKCTCAHQKWGSEGAIRRSDTQACSYCKCTWAHRGVHKHHKLMHAITHGICKITDKNSNLKMLHCTATSTTTSTSTCLPIFRVVQHNAPTTVDVPLNTVTLDM